MKVDLTIRHKIKRHKINIYYTDLKDNFLTPINAEILYTEDNFGKTISIQFENQQVTFDYDKLKEIVEGKNNE